MSIQNRLYISTVAADAPELAREHSLGLEIADYCTAYNMDLLREETSAAVHMRTEGIRRVTFHAPFSELCPAAIDPLVREVTKKRYLQAAALAEEMEADKLIVHAGFIPRVYFPEWFVPESVSFWRELLPQIPSGLTVCLENVMEPTADMLCDIVSTVDDPRLRLCLDIGHANTEVSRQSVPDWAEAEAPWLSHVHIHDNLGGDDLHLPLGRGSMDLPAILDRLEAMCPAVTYTIENPMAAESVHWLGEHGYI